MSNEAERRGVLLDLGSVLARVDIDDFDQLAADVGADLDDLVEVLVGDYADDNDHPFHRAERGEVTLTAALDDIEPLAQARGFSIASLRTRLLEPSAELNTPLLDEVARLRHDGWWTGVITNSVVEYAGIIDALLPWDELFDVVIDSCRVGMRKPDPRIFRRALGQTGLEPTDVLFVDDQAGNVAAAAALGMRTLHAERYDLIASQVRNLADKWVVDPG